MPVVATISPHPFVNGASKHGKLSHKTVYRPLHAVISRYIANCIG